MRIKNKFQNIIYFIKNNKKKFFITFSLGLLIFLGFIPIIFNSARNFVEYQNANELSDIKGNEFMASQKDNADEIHNENNENFEETDESGKLDSEKSGNVPKDNSESKSFNSLNSENTNGANTAHVPSYPSLPSPPPPAKGKHVVGYYMCWSRYKGFTPDNIDTSKITHLNYAFADLKSDLSIGLVDSNVDLKNFELLRNIKKNNKNFRTLISIGGWDYSKFFSNAAASGANREIFAQNCLNFVLDHGFDGVDIDWEYPVSGGLSGNTNRPEDKQNLTLLLSALRNKLNEQSAKDGKNYYLTMAVAPTAGYINKIEANSVASIVDFMFIMGYDFNGPWDHYANFNAPLYVKTGVPSAGQGSVSQGINVFLNAGVPASKLVLGVPFYGYQYTVTNTVNNGLGSTFTGSNSLSYDEIAAKFLNDSSYKIFFDSDSKVPYLFGNNTFISFENEQSMTEKVNFAKSKGFAGMGVWEVSFDRSSKLLSVIHNLLK